jgi:4-hydroxybenzoate polyprenyltransferase
MLQANIRDYLFIARLDHWPKNILVLPGCAFAILILDLPVTYYTFLRIALVLFSICLLASANYTINEWLDASYDRFHPIKKERPGASGRLNPYIVYIEYSFIAIVGLMAAYSISLPLFLVAGIFLFMGLVYNVPPVRAKERVYLDVITESINNPLRFILGWLALSDVVFPPSSILLAYWAGGGFLMSVKRYAEFRFFNSPVQASMYRKSFSYYTEQSLLLFIFSCAIFSSFFLGIFLIKYRVEYILLFPLITILFVWYLSIGMRPLSAAQSPEKLFREKKFFLFTLFLIGFTIMLSLIDIPLCDVILTPINYIKPLS